MRVKVNAQVWLENNIEKWTEIELGSGDTRDPQTEMSGEGVPFSPKRLRQDSALGTCVVQQLGCPGRDSLAPGKEAGSDRAGGRWTQVRRELACGVRHTDAAFSVACVGARGGACGPCSELHVTACVLPGLGGAQVEGGQPGEEGGAILRVSEGDLLPAAATELPTAPAVTCLITSGCPP